jgi:hypothetical protein
MSFAMTVAVIVAGLFHAWGTATWFRSHAAYRGADGWEAHQPRHYCQWLKPVAFLPLQRRRLRLSRAPENPVAASSSALVADYSSQWLRACRPSELTPQRSPSNSASSAPTAPVHR